MQSPIKIWRNQKKINALVGKTGKVVSWTVIRVPSADFSDQAPYPVAIVELENGCRTVSQLVDWQPEHLRIGQQVITVVRRVTQPDPDGVIQYGIKIKPLE